MSLLIQLQQIYFCYSSALSKQITVPENCNLPKIQEKRQENRPHLRIFCQKDANGIANSEDPDQTAPLGAV